MSFRVATCDAISVVGGVQAASIFTHAHACAFTPLNNQVVSSLLHGVYQVFKWEDAMNTKSIDSACMLLSGRHV